jgi:hypothetical protein
MSVKYHKSMPSRRANVAVRVPGYSPSGAMHTGRPAVLCLLARRRSQTAHVRPSERVGLPRAAK